MICDRCHERPAAIFLTKVVNGDRTELHLCNECAEKGDSEFFKDMSLISILANLAGSKQKQQTEAAPAVACENCGFTLERFRREGKLGCEQCYRQFTADLTPMMRKIHGSLQHTGKRPETSAAFRVPLEKKRVNKLEELKLHLKQAVKAEEYEQAAVLRDEIRAMEMASDGAAK
jgi:protein arginine kinase activator